MLESTMKALVAGGREMDLECKEYPNYSGRGMFGKSTCGVTLESKSGLLASASMAVLLLCKQGKMKEAEEFIDDIAKTGMDNMGLGVIVY